MARVEVRPIEKEIWHDKKGRDAFARPIVIEPLISIQTGQFATGLSEDDRTRIEGKTGYNLSPDYMVGTPHEFWNAPVSAIKLAHKTNIFDTSKPLDEIKVFVMKASDLVANSMKDYEAGKFPEALFYIFDEQEEEGLKASKAATVRKVVIEAAKLTKTRKADLVQVLSGISVKNQSDDYVDLKLDEAIAEEGAEAVLNLIKRDKKRVSLHSLVLEAIHKNVLRKDGTAVYYMDDQLGYDVESAVDYFADSKNQTLKAQILEKIN